MFYTLSAGAVISGDSVHSLGAVFTVFTVSSFPHVSMQCSQSPHFLRSPCSVHRLHISSQLKVSSFPHVTMRCSQSHYLLIVQSPHLLTSPCNVNSLHISSQFTVSSFPHVSTQCSQSPYLLTVHSLLISSCLQAVSTVCSVSSSPHVYRQCPQSVQSPHLLMSTRSSHSLFTVSSSPHLPI